MVSHGIKSIARNTGFTLIAHAFNIATRAIYLVVVARAFGPSVYGALAYTQSLYGMFLFAFLFGFKPLLSQQIGIDKEKGAVLSREIWAIRMLLLGLLFTIFTLSGYFLHQDPLIKKLSLVMAVALVGRSFSGHCAEVFGAYERSELNLKPELSLRSAELVIAISVTLIYHDILYVGLVHAVSWAIQGIISYSITRKHFNVHKPLWNWNKFLGILRNAAPLAISSLFLGTMLQWPILIVKKVSDTADVGNVSILIQATVMLCTLSWSLASASIPVISRSLHREDGKVRSYVLTVFRSACFVGLTVLVAGQALSGWVLEVLIGDRFPIAVAYASYPLLLAPVLSLATAFGAVLLSMSRYWTMAFQGVASAIIFPLILYIFPGAGPVHAALAALGGTRVLVIIWQLAIFWRLHMLQLRKDIIPIVVICMLVLSAYYGLLDVSLTAAIALSLSILALAVPLTLSQAERRKTVALLTKRRTGI